MLKTYLKVKSAALVALLNRRLSEVPLDERDELARNLKDEADIYPRPLLLIFALASCAIAVLADTCCYRRVETRKLGAIDDNGSGSDLLCMVRMGMVAPMDCSRPAQALTPPGMS